MAEQSVRIAVGRFREPVTVSGTGLSLVGTDGTKYETDGPIVL